MYCRKGSLKLSVAGLAVVAAATTAYGAAENPRFDGAAALRFTQAAVDFGPRPPGSPAIRKLQAYIGERLRPLRCHVTEDSFTANTPHGKVAMKNIIAHFPGTSGRAVAISGHYDTKKFNFRFVGANDAGSSTGFLLALAQAVHSMQHRDDIYIVFFDGEESFGQWSSTDGLYGSRHLAERWRKEGKLQRLRALINVDMIGDKDLNLVRDHFSSPALVRLVWQIARELNYGAHFSSATGAIEDDHVPFARLGVPVIDLIDFDYGPGNSYWHSAQDTMDKLSARSFQIVGDVVLEAIRRLERQ
jgi:glutaminyl-peptide cyclotransferase